MALAFLPGCHGPSLGPPWMLPDQSPSLRRCNIYIVLSAVPGYFLFSFTLHSQEVNLTYICKPYGFLKQKVIFRPHVRLTLIHWIAL